MKFKNQILEISKNRVLRSYSKVLENKYPDLLNQIIQKTKFLKKDAKLSERIFCIVNDIKGVIKCKNENCSNFCTFRSYTKKYNEYCSNSCAQSNSSLREQIKKTYKEKYGNNKIIQKKREKTCLEKYGVSCPFQHEKVKNKSKQTCLERYGTEYHLQSEKTRKKVKKTNLEKYGVENVFQSEIIKDKIKQTCIQKYGVENVMFDNSIKEKLKETNLEKHGVENVFQSEKIKNKMKNTWLNKYGKNHPCKNKQIKEKAIKTTLERYGKDNYMQSHITDSNFQKLNTKEWLKNQHLIKKKSCVEIAQDLGVVNSTVRVKLNQFGIDVNHYYNVSFAEKEIFKFIEDKNIVILKNNRKIISPYELDIYIPEYKLAIEFNGAFWHSSYSLESDKKYKNYHLMKTEMCKKKGIQLLHIFENEWLDEKKQNIWKSIINSNLGKNETINSDNCEIKEIKDNSLIHVFLDNNNLQGFSNGSIKLGLFYGNELVSLIVFDKHAKYGWEMIRFCDKKYLNIIGGAEKLFKYFVEHHNPKSIIGYVDKRYDSGKEYKELRFIHLYDSSPNYFYFKINEMVLHPRVKFQKHKLVKLLENFDENKSEAENMYENGYRRIWDCGYMTFFWEEEK